MSKRGLVIGPPFTVDVPKGQFSTASTDQTKQLQRLWVLMFDEIHFVDQMMIKGPDFPDQEFLSGEGIFTTSRGQFPSGSPTNGLVECIRSAMDQFEAKEPGVWALATGPGTFDPAPTDVFRSGAPDRGALVTLHNAIPVPDREVPLAEILEFKAKRRDELLALRHHIEGVHQAAQSMSDPSLGLNTAAESIRLASDDCLRTMREARIPFRLTTEILSANFVGGGLAAVASISAHAPLATLLSNVIGAGITVGAGVEWVKRRNSKNPFRYVASFHEQVFGE